jgi:hypothetical protein
MADSDFNDRFVTLRGCMVVPAPAYILLLDLEARNFTLAMEGSTLVVRPPERLTRVDCAGLKRWKWFVAMLIGYVADDSHLFADRPALPAAMDTRRTA